MKAAMIEAVSETRHSLTPAWATWGCCSSTALDLERGDAEAPGIHQIIRSAPVPDIAVGIDLGQVPRREPLAPHAALPPNSGGTARGREW